MRNINKIKELKDDRYTFSLDNKQIVSIIISTISLGIVLFSTGYFIGKERVNKKTINNEIKTKNIAIINTNTPNKKKKDIQSNTSTNKSKLIASNKNIVKTKSITEINVANKKNEILTNSKKIEDKTKVNIVSKATVDSTINIPPKLLKKTNHNKGTGDKPFKTILNSNEKGKYIIQVLATPKAKEAKELKNRLIESGYKAFIEQVDSNGVLYNRVRIGFFKNSEEAKLFKNSFEKESGIKKTFITIKK